MKYLRLILCLTTVALLTTATVTRAESYDSETATIQKKSAHTAKVVIGKDTTSAPITFADGADWTTVKDHYEVVEPVAAGLKNGTMMISIGADGTASFTKCQCKKESTKSKK